MLTFLYGKLTQDSRYQILSELARYYGRYDKIFCVFFGSQCSSVNDNLIHDVMLSIHLVLGLPRVRKHDVEPCVISFSGQDPFLPHI